MSEQTRTAVTGGPSGPAAPGTSVGAVAGLRAFPVKSMDAAPLQRSAVLSSGLAHDRGWAVVGADGVVLTARTAPRLREVIASVPVGDGAPGLRLPGADEEADAAALSELVGAPVSVRAAQGPGPGFNEVAPVHVVSRQAIEAASHAPTDGADCACSVEEPRANLVLDLVGTELETAWVGRELQAGDVVLRVTAQPKHCLGVYAEVLTAGDVAVGDVVRLR
jgi:hypothetical protein